MRPEAVNWTQERDHRNKGLLSPLRLAPIGDWQGATIPEREWIVPGVLPKASITLLTGDGGLGKSLIMQQLQTACAIGGEWLGVPVQKCRSFALYCEDDEDELQRRQADINRAYGVDFEDIAEDVAYASRTGEENILMEFDRRSDVGKKTPLFEQVSSVIRESQARLVIIDTAADTFGGNENVRTQVRQFVNALRRFALESGGGVILTAHPSLMGITSGSGISGSTAWNNSVRSRVYLTRPKGQEGEPDPDVRELKLMKSNYSRFGDKLSLRWEGGVFRRIEDASSGIHGIVDRIDADNKIVDGLRWYVENGTMVSSDPQTKTSLSPLIRKLPSCKHLSHADVLAAQDRLIDKGKIVRVEMGPPSKRRVYLRPKDCLLPGEGTARYV